MDGKKTKIIAGTMIVGITVSTILYESGHLHTHPEYPNTDISNYIGTYSAIVSGGVIDILPDNIVDLGESPINAGERLIGIK